MTPRPEASPPSEGAPGEDRRRPAYSVKLFSDRTTVLEAAVWENHVRYPDGNAGVQYSVALTRQYKNGDGQWKPSTSYRAHDIPILLWLAGKAHDWICERRAAAPF